MNSTATIGLSMPSELPYLVAIAGLFVFLYQRPFGHRSVIMNGVTICYDTAKVSGNLLRKFTPLQKWTTNIANGLLSNSIYTLEEVKIRDVFMFGPRIGFVFMEVLSLIHI